MAFSNTGILSTAIIGGRAKRRFFGLVIGGSTTLKKLYWHCRWQHLHASGIYHCRDGAVIYNVAMGIRFLVYARWLGIFRKLDEKFDRVYGCRIRKSRSYYRPIVLKFWFLSSIIPDWGFRKENLIFHRVHTQWQKTHRFWHQLYWHLIADRQLGIQRYTNLLTNFGITL